jgi:hypothetical protein
MKSVPEQNIFFDGVNLSVALPSAINQVLQGVRFVVAADRQIRPGIREIEFSVTYNDRPVSLLHYRFWDGRENNGTGQVRDGISTIRLAGSSAAFDRITVYPQYAYYTARTENKTVEELWELVIRPEFENAIAVSLTTAPPIAATPEMPLNPTPTNCCSSSPLAISALPDNTTVQTLSWPER